LVACKAKLYQITLYFTKENESREREDGKGGKWWFAVNLGLLGRDAS
jgi:hypothetical protein